MTTIACKDRTMACDSCWTDSNWLVGTSRNKIIKLKSGALLGEAGDNDTRAVVKLLQGVKNFGQLPTARELAECAVDYTAIILFPSGEMAQISIERHAESSMSYVANAWPVNRGMSSVGTGAAVAIGAMASGKTASQAVAIACSWDPNSKMPVHEEALPPKRRT